MASMAGDGDGKTLKTASFVNEDRIASGTFGATIALCGLGGGGGSQSNQSQARLTKIVSTRHLCLYWLQQPSDTKEQIGQTKNYVKKSINFRADVNSPSVIP